MKWWMKRICALGIGILLCFNGISVENFSNLSLFNSLKTVADDVEYSVEYRYCTKTTKTSNVKLSSPWVYESEYTEYSDWGSWSSWGTSPVSSSDTRQVETEQRQGDPESYVMINYRTRGNASIVQTNCYKVNTSSGVNVRSGAGTGYSKVGASPNGTTFIVDQISGNWAHTNSIYCTNGTQSGWVCLDYCSASGNNYVQYRNYSVAGNYSSYGVSSSFGEYVGSDWIVDAGTINSARVVSAGDFASGFYDSDNCSNFDGYNKSSQDGYILFDGHADMIWFVKSINYAQETWYRYRERSLNTIYTYYMLSEWSDWSSVPITASDTIIVETRKVPVVTTTTTTITTTTTTTASTTVTTTLTNVPATTTTKETNDNAIIFGCDNYCFINNKEFFNSKYNIADELKEQLSKKSDNLGWDNINSLIESPWDGSCYGMASVEVLSKSGQLDVRLLDDNASTLYNVSSPIDNADSESYINYYHVLQKSSVVQKKINNYIKKTNKDRLNEIISMAASVEKGGIPVLICFNFSKSASRKLDGGHAVVGYGVEYGTWTYTSKYNCRILISDPNSVEFKDEMCLYINTDTYEWQIPYYQEKYYSCTNTNQDTKDKPWAQILFATNDINLIDTFGLLKSDTISDAESKDSIISIDTTSNNFGVAYYDDKTGTINDSNFELDFYSDAFDSKNNSTVNAVLPQADVAYEYYEKVVKAFNTAVEYTNSKFEVDVSSGNYAIYKPDDSVEFVGESSDYTLSMTLNDGYHPTDWYKISVSGEDSNNSRLEISGNGYILISDSLSDGIFIETSNRTVKANLGVIVDYDSVYIYEIDETHIGIKLDTDNNGTYETDFNPQYVGDANQDGTISITDIVLFQKYLLNITNIDKKQYISMDMNLDGYVNVIDLVLAKKCLLES